MSQKIANLPLRKLRKLLEHQNCKHTRTSGGHETWTRKDLLRPIVIQTHIDPVPEFIVKQVMRSLDIDRDKLAEILSEI